jgi:hypothetical protein
MTVRRPPDAALAWVVDTLSNATDGSFRVTWRRPCAIVSSMPVSDIELRVHRRVEFFRVPAENQALPVWVFMPAGIDDAVAGLVLNFSDGGVQVLTNAEEPLDGAAFELQLLLGEDDAVPRFRAQVSRVWTREAETLGRLSGLRFEQRHSSAEDFIRRYQAGRAKERWVRCLLIRRH